MFIGYLDILFCEVPVKISCLFSYWVFFLLICGSSLHILDMIPLSDMCAVKLPIFDFFILTLLMVSSDEWKFLTLMQTNLSLFSFRVSFFVTRLTNICLTKSHEYILLFLSSSFISPFIFSSIVHLELNFVYDMT